MRRLLLTILILGFGTALLGCQQGVTDVGNPSINKPAQNSPDTVSPGPTIGQLIGGYSIPTPVDAVQARVGHPHPQQPRPCPRARPMRNKVRTSCPHPIPNKSS